jgi:hypothetical protein
MVSPLPWIVLFSPRAPVMSKPAAGNMCRIAIYYEI